jgi:hypothetical protein
MDVIKGEERITFESSPQRSVINAEENVATQALKAYFGDQAISALDYAFRCIVHAQQQVIEAQHVALAAQEGMHTAQQNIIAAQQDANQEAINAQQHEALSNEAICETGLYKKVISELIFKLRKSLYESPNVLPVRIYCPRTPYPNTRDTEYVGPPRPQTESQVLARQISAAISNAIHRMPHS